MPGTKAGGPVRSVHSLIQNLGDNFDFYILTKDTDLGESKPYSNIESDAWLTKANYSIYYLSNANLTGSKINSIINELKPEVLYINSFWSYWFSILLLELYSKNKISSRIILAPRGMLGKNSLKIKPFKKMLYLQLSKFRNSYRGIHFQASNETELNDIQKYFPKNEISIVPNLTSIKAGHRTRIKEINKIELFFLSRIVPIKGLKEALEYLKDIREVSIDYYIYGNIEDDSYWNICQSIIKTLPKNISVNKMDEIPFNKIEETISRHHALFMPTKNENFGHAIVESLCCACPVIISDQTPWNNLEDFKAGFNCKLEDKSKWTSSVIAVAKTNQEEYTAMSNAAVNYINEKNNLLLIKEKYIKLFNGK
ncbi:MAG: glycosyltransferase [Bacteroidia bacterium]